MDNIPSQNLINCLKKYCDYVGKQYPSDSIMDGVIDNPEILQNDPICDGWLLIIKSESNVLLDELMTSDEYKSKVVPN